MTRKIFTAGLSVALAASGLLLTTSPSQAGLSTAASAPVATHFAFEASGYSTRVVGGQLPAGSDRTAFQVIGCTNKAGLSKRNAEATANFTPLITVTAAKTHVWTTLNNGVASSWAQNKISQVTLGDSTTPSSATINGITSRSHAFHNSTGFHARTTTAVVSVDPDGSGPLPPQSGPTPGNPIVIPGVARISVGPKQTSHGPNGASAQADALRVKIIPTGTVAYFAHSRATIGGGVVSGLFRGSSYASRATALDGHVTSGKTPFLVMPCQGTNGVFIRRDVARINPNGLILKGLHADQVADQTTMKAYGHERGRVARLRLGNTTDQLVVRGIVGRANVYFVKGQGITKDVKGSHVLGVTLNGQRTFFGPDNTIEIPGLVLLERHIVKRTKLTIQITELRATLLGGPDTGAVIDLGVAKVGFTRAGL